MSQLGEADRKRNATDLQGVTGRDLGTSPSGCVELASHQFGGREEDLPKKDLSGEIVNLRADIS